MLQSSMHNQCCNWSPPLSSIVTLQWDQPPIFCCNRIPYPAQFLIYNQTSFAYGNCKQRCSSLHQYCHGDVVPTHGQSGPPTIFGVCVLYMSRFIVIYLNMDTKNMVLKWTIKWDGGSIILCYFMKHIYIYVRQHMLRQASSQRAQHNLLQNLEGRNIPKSSYINIPSSKSCNNFQLTKVKSIDDLSCKNIRIKLWVVTWPNLAFIYQL